MNTIRWRTRAVVGLLMVCLTLLCTLALFRSVAHEDRLEFTRKGKLHRLPSVHQSEETAKHAIDVKTETRSQLVERLVEPEQHAERVQTSIPKTATAVKTEQTGRQETKVVSAKPGKVNSHQGSDTAVVTSKENNYVGNGDEVKLHFLKDHVFKLNIEERMMNFEKFPSPLDEDAFLLAVQVHDRKEYFEHFIASLRTVRNIERSVVVVSHDFYSPEMDRLVASIDVCKVIQIFYPYNLQIYSDKFPGQDPNDCPREISRELAKKSGCKNADYPDQFGHYREAKFTMTKHHWWWKVNHIFDHMRLTQRFNGYVIFLEEDHFLAPDFLHVAKLIADAKPRICPNCQFIGMGNYDKITSYQGIGNAVKAVAWESGKFNMGFAMNRQGWNEIRKCNTMFCNFDDYNWDWTLQSLGKRCLNKPIGILVVRASRVFHIGQCGVHHKQKLGAVTSSFQCNAASTVSLHSRTLKNNELYLFPGGVVLIGSSVVTFTGRLANPQSYGGWGDVRDHKLCESYVNNSYTLS